MPSDEDKLVTVINENQPKVGLSQISKNKILYIASLLLNGPSTPQTIDKKYLKDLKKLFEFLSPDFKVTLDTGNPNQPTDEATIRFTSMKDFDPEEIIKRTKVLLDLQTKFNVSEKTIEAIAKSGVLEKLFADPSLLDAVQNILAYHIQELTQSKE